MFYELILFFLLTHFFLFDVGVLGITRCMQSCKYYRHWFQRENRIFCVIANRMWRREVGLLLISHLMITSINITILLIIFKLPFPLTRDALLVVLFKICLMDIQGYALSFAFSLAHNEFVQNVTLKNKLFLWPLIRLKLVLIYDNHDEHTGDMGRTSRGRSKTSAPGIRSLRQQRHCLWSTTLVSRFTTTVREARQSHGPEHPRPWRYWSIYHFPTLVAQFSLF